MVFWRSILGSLSVSIALCNALPQDIRYIRTNWHLSFTRQAISDSDAACPDGFICTSIQCPSDVICAEDEECVDFGGTIGCARSGYKVCAVNPSSLQAVMCLHEDGVCCHGNCYAAGAVCCDFPNTKCSVGELCSNVCEPGETCGSGVCNRGGTSSAASSATLSASNTQVIISTLPVTSDTSSSQSTSTVSRDSTLSLSETTAALSTNTLSSISTPSSASVSSSLSSSTSTTAPVPTLVPTADSFSNVGCFVDSSSALALVADSTSDNSTTGMSVEKCVDFAEQGGWRYAGVEDSGDCHVGNTLHNAVAAPQSQCNQPCAGASNELCGALNRVQVYSDPSWYYPDADQVRAAVLQYNASLAGILSSTKDFNVGLAQLKELQSQNQRSIQRRDIFDVTKLLQDSAGRLNQAVNTANNLARSLNILTNRATAADYNLVDVGGEEGIPLLTTDERLQFNQGASQVQYDATNSILPKIQNVLSLLEAGAWESIDTALAEAAILEAVGKIGVPIAAIGTVATGVYKIIDWFLGILFSSSPTPSPTTSLIPTPTTTTSTTAAVATTMVVLTNKGTSVDDFNLLVNDLDMDESLTTTMVYPNLDFQGFSAPLNVSQQDTVLKSKIINVMVENVISTDPDYDESSTVSQIIAARSRVEETASGLKVARIKNEKSQEARHDQNSSFVKRAIISQPNSPTHLKLISNPSSGIDMDYTYNDQAAGQGVNIYALDTGILATHVDFAQLNLRTRVARDAGPSTLDDFNHGTTILSLAGGTTYGVSKKARLIMVKINYDHVPFDQFGNPVPPTAQPQFSAANVADGLMFIINDVLSQYAEGTLQRGKAVINVSLGFSTGFGMNFDVNRSIFEHLLSQVYAADIVFVTSAGNQPHDISNDALKSFGGPATPMIVVGGVEADTLAIWPQSGFGNALTVRAQSTNTHSAGNGGNTAVAISRGTSQAAGMVSGLASYFLSHPQIAPQLLVQGQTSMRVKSFILASAQARTLPGAAASVIACNGENYTPAEAQLRQALFDASL